MWWFLTSAALAAPCAEQALALLERHDPEGHAAVLQLDDPTFFQTWLRCEEGPPYALGTAVHEVIHRLGGPRSLADGRYTIATRKGPVEVHWPERLFPRSEIADRLLPAERGPFVQPYLVGATGAQDGLILLDELNAYARGLRTEYHLRRAHPLPAGMQLGARDGLAVFQYWTTLYLAIAREEHPEAWAQLRQPDIAGLIATVWRDAEEALALSCAQPQLGMFDAWYLRRVYVGGLDEELRRVAPGLEPRLPGACRKAVERASPPDHSSVAVDSQLARFSERVEQRAIRIEVNGETLSLEDLEARAATDPRWQRLWEEVRSQLPADSE